MRKLYMKKKKKNTIPISRELADLLVSRRVVLEFLKSEKSRCYS